MGIVRQFFLLCMVIIALPTMLALKPQVQRLTVVIGDIYEQHPRLVLAFLVFIVLLILLQSWILRLFLRLFGFGPLGPVKGSPAACLQRYFWGAAVASGSWFAWFQAAGMGVFPWWAGLVATTLLLIGVVWAILFLGRNLFSAFLFLSVVLFLTGYMN
ncbi:hypothetical protein OG21DRAFT_1501251 [Imleria badia]|nr:hypothetical protein OG21DRAFT_1501251 [Imleria badia]